MTNPEFYRLSITFGRRNSMFRCSKLRDYLRQLEFSFRFNVCCWFDAKISEIQGTLGVIIMIEGSELHVGRQQSSIWLLREILISLYNVPWNMHYIWHPRSSAGIELRHCWLSCLYQRIDISIELSYQRAREQNWNPLIIQSLLSITLDHLHKRYSSRNGIQVSGCRPYPFRRNDVS